MVGIIFSISLTSQSAGEKRSEDGIYHTFRGSIGFSLGRQKKKKVVVLHMNTKYYAPTHNPT